MNTQIRADDHERERLIGVQYLRALAALQVVVYHSSVEADRLILLGNFGVPLFFVVSGFIMMVVTERECSPFAFLRRRIARVAPIYWIATTTLLGLAALQGWAFWADRARWPHVAFSYLFLPWGRANADEHFFPILGVGWTLNYEMFFYALVGLSLLLPGRFKVAALSAVMLGLVALGALAQPTFAILAFWTEPVILQFLAGVWIGAWWLRGKRRFLWPLAACVVLLSFALLSGPFQQALLGALKGSVLLLAALWLEGAGLFRKPFAPLRLLGDASYSIYLWHPLILIVLGVIFHVVALPKWPLLPLGILASIVGGIIAYLVLERPLMRFLRLPRFSRGVPVPAGP
ncbi:MAG TPA: acyltransferase [Allosphingosinicella sp.]|jgi:exopolysaccharide production protein ExoZ